MWCGIPFQTVLDFQKQYKLDKYCATFQMEVSSALDRNRIRTKYKTLIETHQLELMEFIGAVL